MTSSETSHGPSRGRAATAWWSQFCHPVKGDAAVRAQLRRCRSTSEVLGVPAGIVLLHRLGVLGGLGEPSLDARVVRALGLARVLAHVKEDDDGAKLMAVLGWKKPPIGAESNVDVGERPRLSEVRFRRLLQVREGDEQTVAFIRLVRLAEGRVSVAALSQDYLVWHRDATKHRWAFDYYGATSAAPSTIQSHEGISA